MSESVSDGCSESYPHKLVWEVPNSEGYTDKPLWAPPAHERAVYDQLRTDPSSALCAWLPCDAVDLVLRPMINPLSVLCAYGNYDDRGSATASCWRADTWAPIFTSRKLPLRFAAPGFDVPVVDGIVHYDMSLWLAHFAGCPVGLTTGGSWRRLHFLDTVPLDTMSDCATVMCDGFSVALGGLKWHRTSGSHYERYMDQVLSNKPNDGVHLLTGSVRGGMQPKPNVCRWSGARATPPVVHVGSGCVLICSPPLALAGYELAQWTLLDVLTLRSVATPVERDLAMNALHAVCRDRSVIVDQGGSGGDNSQWWQQDVRQGKWSRLAPVQSVGARKLLWVDEHTVVGFYDGVRVESMDLRNNSVRCVVPGSGTERICRTTVVCCQ